MEPRKQGRQGIEHMRGIHGSRMTSAAYGVPLYAVHVSDRRREMHIYHILTAFQIFNIATLSYSGICLKRYSKPVGQKRVDAPL